ncbi:hypothetical protein CHS0354_013229 [Potamilus streckersoni]|uniref:CHCH domain-containing protein n=1 Tax=Potamilus streckersoni TaxID=2493646 RepID=A0AAE0SRU6_9BIVA|nr:hypothetical protein CHS0354_013229 [Potamilus streckersoni]
MPRRGRSSSPVRPAPRPAASVPAHPPPSQPAPVMMQQPKQPGMFAQMATTAAGVAVGSAVGHTIGAAMTGGMGGGSREAAPAPVQQQAPAQQFASPCEYELKEFLQCAQGQSDISLCYGFNEALKECKNRNGVSI